MVSGTDRARARGRVDDALARVRDTRTLRIEAGAIDAVCEVLRTDFPGERALVIADERTFAAAGARVAAQLRAADLLVGEPLVFPGDPPPYADREHLARVAAALREAEAVPVAVGAGTINDLTKLAAHDAGRAYTCVATAASMDGYTSFGAIVTERGFKRTIGCPAPRAVIADLDVLAAAPRELNAAGYGDLLGKITAGADWLVADALGIEPIHVEAWSLVQDPLRSWLADPAAVRAGNREALERLFEGLTVVGIAMQCSSSSRPASGAEHRFSHLWEMEAITEGRPAHLHGAKVAVGSIATAALYERLLTRDLRRLDVEAAVRAHPSPAQAEAHARRSHRDSVIAENAVRETRAKAVDRDVLRDRLERLRAVWGDLVPALAAQLLPPATLHAMLAAAGAPTRPEQIGVDRRRFRAAHDAARSIRARYTVLDVLSETGLLRPIVAEVLGPGGYWRRASADDAR